MTKSVKTGRGTRPRGTRIDVWVTPEERAEITERASQTGLSASAYLRTAGFSCSVPSLINRDALDDFVRLSGELNEVGRLLKLWLEGNPGEDGVDVSVLFQNLNRIKGEMQRVAPRLLNESGSS